MSIASKSAPRDSKDRLEIRRLGPLAPKVLGVCSVDLGVKSLFIVAI